MIDLFSEDVQDQEDTPGSVPGEFLFATCWGSGGGSSSSLRLKFDGDADYSSKYYRTLNGSSIASGSRVLVLKVSGSYIILGRVYS